MHVPGATVIAMSLFQEPRSDDDRIQELRSVSKRASERVDQQTRDERATINAIIWEFVLSRNRIVYGGAALNALISGMDTLESPRTEESEDEVTDIEFYSPEPGRDVVELCDIFKSAPGMEFVQGREAVHVGTMTISVQFRRCCDITFMPRKTVEMLPIMRLMSGVRCVHPHVMAMDLLRMLTEPDTSYWRLEKAFARLRLLEEHFPLTWEYVDKTATTDAAGQCVTETLIPGLLGKGGVIVGAHAATFFEERLDDIVMDTATSHRHGCLQIVTICYDEDVGNARMTLIGYGTAHTEVCLDAFGDLLGRSTRFLDRDGRCVVEMIDAHPRCVPCSPVLMEHGRVASSLFCLATGMACHLRAFVTRDKVTLSQQSLICTRLMASRKSSRDVVHRTAFEDFGLDHILGKTVSDMILHAIAKSKGKTRSWLRYNPCEGRSEAEARKRMWLASFTPRTGRVRSTTQLG